MSTELLISVGIIPSTLIDAIAPMLMTVLIDEAVHLWTAMAARQAASASDGRRERVLE